MAVPPEKISELMKIYIEYGEKIKSLEKEQGFIRELVRNHLKEQNRKQLKFDGNIALMSVYERVSFDREKLVKLLTPVELQEVVKLTKVETVKIMSEETMQRMQYNIKKGEQE